MHTWCGLWPWGSQDGRETNCDKIVFAVPPAQSQQQGWQGDEL